MTGSLQPKHEVNELYNLDLRGAETIFSTPDLLTCAGDNITEFSVPYYVVRVYHLIKATCHRATPHISLQCLQLSIIMIPRALTEICDTNNGDPPPHIEHVC